MPAIALKWTFFPATEQFVCVGSLLDAQVPEGTESALLVPEVVSLGISFTTQSTSERPAASMPWTRNHLAHAGMIGITSRQDSSDCEPPSSQFLWHLTRFVLLTRPFCQRQSSR